MRAAGLALVLGGPAALLIIATVAAHDGEHAGTSAGFQYTDELRVAGIVAGFVATTLVVAWVRRRWKEIEA